MNTLLALCLALGTLAVFANGFESAGQVTQKKHVTPYQPRGSQTPWLGDIPVYFDPEFSELAKEYILGRASQFNGPHARVVRRNEFPPVGRAHVYVDAWPFAGGRSHVYQVGQTRRIMSLPLLDWMFADLVDHEWGHMFGLAHPQESAARWAFIQYVDLDAIPFDRLLNYSAHAPLAPWQRPPLPQQAADSVMLYRDHVGTRFAFIGGVEPERYAGQGATAADIAAVRAIGEAWALGAMADDAISRPTVDDYVIDAGILILFSLPGDASTTGACNKTGGFITGPDLDDHLPLIDQGWTLREGMLTTQMPIEDARAAVGDGVALEFKNVAGEFGDVELYFRVGPDNTLLKTRIDF